jgi:type II secretory pathway component GspD/PulD (secretin)
LVLGLTMLGCSSNKNELDNEDLDTLLAAYRQQNAELQKAREAALGHGIVRLEVERGATPGESLVTVDLDGARLSEVVRRTLDHAAVGYVDGTTRRRGTVTAKFQKRPLVEALRYLLAPSGLSAYLHDGMLSIAPVPELAEPDVALGADEDGPPSSLEVALTYVQTERAISALDAIYPKNEDTGVRAVEFAPMPEFNSVLLSGPRRDMEAARRMLAALDHDPGDILLEALVVEFNVQSFVELGSRIENGAKGTLSNFFFNVAELVGDTISFTRVADAANTTAFRAVLKLLMERDQARVISRPYVAAVSGSAAHLEVVEDRFVLVTTPGEINVNLQPVTSGVKLDLLPVLTADGSILLHLTIESSEFQSTLENVQQRRQRNSITTFAHVDSGQTVIVGGLMLRNHSTSRAGWPYLSRIPPFNLLFGHEDERRQDQQVMIFITPYQWDPGLDPPLTVPEPFQVYPEGRPTGDRAAAP